MLDHPEVVVVDSIDKIRQLHNRSTMLRPLQGAGIILQQPQHTCMPAHAASQPAGQVVLVQAPLQVEIPEGMTEAEAQAALAAAGLSPPLLCKPLWTDGRDGSHKLAVLHDLEALGRLLRGQVCHEFKPPLVVQQFVEHGGVLFKVCWGWDVEDTDQHVGDGRITLGLAGWAGCLAVGCHAADPGWGLCVHLSTPWCADWLGLASN